jgi:hypothetical protein
VSNYGGAWRRATLPRSLVPGKPDIDREHSHPSPNLDPTAAHQDYVDTTGAPGLPVEWDQGQYAQDPVASAFFDHTPVSHEDGLGFLPGVDQPSAQAAGGAARSVDLGAPDVRDYDRPRYQGDGSSHVEQLNVDLDGESPATLRYQFKGVGVDIDEFARTNRAIRRRPTGPPTYDMRWYDESMRPKYAPAAHGSRVRPAVAGRLENTPPEGAGTILRPDNWATPVARRLGPNWDTGLVTDGSESPSFGSADNFGLGSWGL